MAKDKAKIKSMTDLLKGSFDIFVKNWVNYLLMSLLLMFAVTLSMGLSFGPEYWQALLRGESQVNAVPQLSPLGILGFFLLIVFSIVLGLAYNKLIYSTAEGNKETISTSLDYGLKNGLSYLLLSLMVGISVVAGFILLIIPGIYLGVVMSFSSQVFVLEGKRGFEAIKRSIELVKGYFWPVFGRILLLVLLLGLIEAVTNQIQFVSLILNLITTPIIAIFTYLIYKDLVAIKK